MSGIVNAHHSQESPLCGVKQGGHDAAITATCVQVCKEFVCPYASCSDCCIVLCWSWLVAVVVVVVECCCCIPYQLALMLVLTLCTFCPDFYTLRLWCYPSINHRKYSTCTHGGGHWLHLVLVAFSFSHRRKHSLHWWWCHPLQLVLVVFFLPPTDTHAPLELKQLSLCGGGLWWYIYHHRVYIYIYISAIGSLRPVCVHVTAF